MLRLHALRLFRDLSQKQLAALTKGRIDQSTLSAIERGRTNPTPDELRVLSSILGCPVDRLLDHVSEVSLLPSGAEHRDAQREGRS